MTLRQIFSAPKSIHAHTRAANSSRAVKREKKTKKIIFFSCSWYYKDITRQQAEAILLEENREGCFLVRDSVSKKNTYTLSVTSKDPDG